MTGFVKGFRTPAIRRREGMHEGRRPKSLEGGNRGGSWRRRWCRLWGFSAVPRFDLIFRSRIGTAGERCDGAVGRRGGEGKGDVAPDDLRFGGGGRRRGLPSAERGVIGEMSGSDRRGGGGWRYELVGHELSSPIDGKGHSRGWQPGVKVSMTTIRPPQQGQVFHASSAWPASAPSPSLLDGAAGMPRSWRANAILPARLALAKRP